MKLRNIMLSCALVLLFLVPLGSAADVTRSLSSETVPAGGTLTVTLTVDVSGANTYYAIDDIYPAGWEVVDSGVGSIKHAGHWKHVVIEDVQDAQFIYTLSAPSEEGTYNFSGEYMFLRMEDTVPITGQDSVSVGGHAPGGNWMIPFWVIPLVIVVAVIAFIVMKKG